MLTELAKRKSKFVKEEQDGVKEVIGLVFNETKECVEKIMNLIKAEQDRKMRALAPKDKE